MTRIATCPQCAAQLSVPEPAADEAQASCPFCNAQFALTGAVRTLRSVALVEAVAKPALGETPFSSQATVHDRLTDSPTLSTLFERFRDIPRSGESEEESEDADETPELADTVVSGSSEKTRDPFDFDAGELGIDRQANIDYQPNALEHNDPVIASSEPDPAARAFVAEVVSVAQAQKRRERGKGSLVRQIVGVVGGGAIGLTLGYFALLWWRGPDGDLLGIADRIPGALLPSSFDTTRGDTKIVSEEPEPPPAESPSEVEQATFTEATPPAQSPSTEEAAPRPLVPSDAQPLPATATVQNAPRHTLDELNAALAVAATARDGLLAGSLSDAAAKRTKGESYVKLCQIAETVTFLVAEGDADLADARQSGRAFFAGLLQEPVARDEIGQIAARWIDYDKRPHGGIFFAGTIVASQQAGSVQELQLELAGGATVAVLTAELLDAQAGTVGVVGSILEKPAERVTGYTGTADRAIWSPLVFAVE